MRPLLPLLFLLLPAISTIAADEDSYRTFHDNKGNSIRALIIRTSPKQVWIRRDDGQTFRMDIEKLSQKDRLYIQEWNRKTELSDPDAIRFTISRFSDGSEQEKTSSRKKTARFSGYAVQLENRTSIDLHNLSIEYRIFARKGAIGKTGQNRTLERKSGFATIASLPSREKAEFKTETIELTTLSLRSGRPFSSRDRPNLNQRRIRDDL